MTSSNQIRKQILDDYYQNVYQKFLFGGGAQGKGIAYFEKQVENFWLNPTPTNVLEIGGGSGEHLPFIEYIPTDSYISLDLRPIITEDHLRNLSEELKSKLRFVEGDAQALPFEDESFDRVFTTCLLHHVDDVLAVLLEARRVTSKGGEIAFILPTDPGILNQLVKRTFSFRKIKKLTKIRPQLFYALEHKNHIQGILEQIRFVFQSDEVKFNFKPFSLIRSWNSNLLVVVKIVRR
jgi:demethylmenaquinone methyltransferase/2-methoxy-6-polyprenyl-1,4-benzoquinol methylase